MPHAPRARWRRSLATQSPGREAEIVRRARRPRRGAAAPSSTAWALASLRSVTLHFAPGAARQALVGDAQASTRTTRAESGRRIGSHGRRPWAAGARIGAETRPTAQRAPSQARRAFALPQRQGARSRAGHRSSDRTPHRAQASVEGAMGSGRPGRGAERPGRQDDVCPIANFDGARSHGGGPCGAGCRQGGGWGAAVDSDRAPTGAGA